jgi:hypothetical protein
VSKGQRIRLPPEPSINRLNGSDVRSECHIEERSIFLKPANNVDMAYYYYPSVYLYLQVFIYLTLAYTNSVALVHDKLY